ncbi:alpha/beta hydrolase [Variovorax robiniae]|uniref:Alpha/beta hydrolase n=1 Tax=Variovorax robiniae TaxID=1836199 RepID=A0ABU8X8D1_9BURK
MKVKANGLQIEVDDSGADGSQNERPVVLLIMGLGMQLIGWPDYFVQPLVDAGFRVIRHDNRDIGLSQGFEHTGQRSIVWQSIRQKIGLRVQSAYSLQDMANDALGVLDALGVQKAHIVGASMGGMIAQRVAATAPQRVLSLTSIMSSSGARGLPGPRPEVARGLFSRPTSRDEDALVDFSVKFVNLIGSPAYPNEPAALARRVRTGIRRAYRPDGLVRQMLAIGADNQRPTVLANIKSPTLVIHGDADKLVPIECGHDTARRIPGSRFVSVPGMGHDLSPKLSDVLMGHIIPFLRGPA